jgi:hypothetical protein
VKRVDSFAKLAVLLALPLTACHWVTTDPYWPAPREEAPPAEPAPASPAASSSARAPRAPHTVRVPGGEVPGVVVVTASEETKEALARWAAAQYEATHDLNFLYNVAVLKDRAEHRRALALIEHILSVDPRHALSLGFLACEWAAQGDLDHAFERLLAAVDAGFDPTAAQRSACFAAARKDPRWNEVVRRGQASRK